MFVRADETDDLQPTTDNEVADTEETLGEFLKIYTLYNISTYIHNLGEFKLLCNNIIVIVVISGVVKDFFQELSGGTTLIGELVIEPLHELHTHFNHE